jgi:hypothetical protein
MSAPAGTGILAQSAGGPLWRLCGGGAGSCDDVGGLARGHRLRPPDDRPGLLTPALRRLTSTVDLVGPLGLVALRVDVLHRVRLHGRLMLLIGSLAGLVGRQRDQPFAADRGSPFSRLGSGSGCQRACAFCRR